MSIHAFFSSFEIIYFFAKFCIIPEIMVQISLLFLPFSLQNELVHIVFEHFQQLFSDHGRKTTCFRQNLVCGQNFPLQRKYMLQKGRIHVIICCVSNPGAISLGCRQAVRHQTLTLAFVGSNPAIPAIRPASSVGRATAF